MSLHVSSGLSGNKTNMKFTVRQIKEAQTKKIQKDRTIQSTDRPILNKKDQHQKQTDHHKTKPEQYSIQTENYKIQKAHQKIQTDHHKIQTDTETDTDRLPKDIVTLKTS